ncbi:UNVERIFIED_CONTAM: cfap97 [Trichonephila clavipes]
MSLRVGLGASQADLDVQGEIDFDFFEASDNTNDSNKKVSADLSNAEPYSLSIVSNGHSKDSYVFNSDLKHAESDPCFLNSGESCSSRNYSKPLITVSCDEATGVIQKTTIETVIPTPFCYKENKCGKISPSGAKKGKKALSPYLKSKVFKDENEISDDSSVSSMSSESLSSVSEDSFELNESDSMTDVSSLASPYNCYSPTIGDRNSKSEKLPKLDGKELKKEGVKFTDDVDKQQCAKCNNIDFHELVNAMNRLKMKQNVSSMCAAKCKSPVISHNTNCRKNFSFSNVEVRKIDHDNQILLKKIMAQQNRPKSSHLVSSQVRSSSAVNRQKHQRQIEIENLALLKRLESTKASRNLSRSVLLRDYDRRTPGVFSRASSRSSYPNSCQSSLRNSNMTSGRSSSISVKSSNSSSHTSLLRSHSASTST